MNPSDHLHIVRLRAPAEQAAALEEWLQALACAAAVDQPAEAPEAVASIYCAERAEAEALLAKLRERGAELAAVAPDAGIDPDIATMPREDWQHSWKRHFRTTRVSPRLVVKPSWEDFAAGPGDVVIELDPGMSFGTGTHATTRACLQFIDELARERPGAALLDYGCGSGILSIAAAKLGCPVSACDHDPDALRIAAENCAHNGVADRVTLWQAELGRDEPTWEWPIVVANILANVLLDHAEDLSRHVDFGGTLVLSGILDSQYEAILTHYRLLGWREEARKCIGEWTSGRFARH